MGHTIVLVELFYYHLLHPDFPTYMLHALQPIAIFPLGLDRLSVTDYF